MTTVLVPAAAGVLSALGLVAADGRRDFVRTYVLPLDEAGELPAEGEADLRYAGQSFELTVPLGPQLAERFHEAHDARYGYADPTRAIELVAVRTAEIEPAPPVSVEGPAFRGCDQCVHQVVDGDQGQLQAPVSEHHEVVSKPLRHAR